MFHDVALVFHGVFQGLVGSSGSFWKRILHEWRWEELAVF